MDVDFEKAVKPAKKLRKRLKAFPPHPTPDDIHSLRTQTRRLEANVHALFPDDDRTAKKLLKAVKPLRKAAGKVRDMDVLLGKTYALDIEPEQECMIKLAERLAGMRRKHLRRLESAIARRGGRARKLLKKFIARMTDGAAMRGGRAGRIRDTAAELEQWPKLHAQNLHEFRIRAKELRYMLQLDPEPDRGTIDAFGRIKDTAGDWHDWVELEKIARKILDAQTDDALLKAIHNAVRDKLRIALTAANAVRRQGLVRLAA